MIDEQISEKIKTFFKAAKELKDANIISSDRYLGDIGEFLAAQEYNVKLSENKREETIDGYIDNESVQIKYSGSPTITNINIGKLDKYDILILVLSKSSKHFPNACVSDLVLYKIYSCKLLGSIAPSEKGKFYITKLILSKFDFDELNYSEL